MTDILQGPVTDIFDGHTFQMNVTHAAIDNKYKYGYEQRVRIASELGQADNQIAPQFTKDLLEDAIKGCVVRIEVDKKDIYGQLVSKVFLVVPTEATVKA